MIKSQFHLKPSSFCLVCSSGEVAISHAVKMKTYWKNNIYWRNTVPSTYWISLWPFLFPSSPAEIMLSNVLTLICFQIKTEGRGKIVKFILCLQIRFDCSCVLELFWSVGENMILKSSPNKYYFSICFQLTTWTMEIRTSHQMLILGLVISKYYFIFFRESVPLYPSLRLYGSIEVRSDLSKRGTEAKMWGTVTVR